MLSPFASLMAGSSLVILIRQPTEKNPFHSALRVDFAKHLALHRNQQHRFFAEFTLSGTAEMLRGVYPEQAERDSSLRSE